MFGVTAGYYACGKLLRMGVSRRNKRRCPALSRSQRFNVLYKRMTTVRTLFYRSALHARATKQTGSLLLWLATVLSDACAAHINHATLLCRPTAPLWIGLTKFSKCGQSDRHQAPLLDHAL